MTEMSSPPERKDSVCESKLDIPKRRRVEESSPSDHKTRSFTEIRPTAHTPLRSRIASSPIKLNDTPSITDKPIPILTPPDACKGHLSFSSETGVDASKSPTEFFVSDPEPEKQTTAETQPSPCKGRRHVSSSMKLGKSPSTIRLSTPNRISTQPRLLEAHEEPDSPISISDIELDQELNKWKKIVSLAEQAQNILKSSKKNHELSKLTESWRSVAYEAANKLRSMCNDDTGLVETRLEELLKKVDDDEAVRKDT